MEKKKYRAYFKFEDDSITDYRCRYNIVLNDGTPIGGKLYAFRSSAFFNRLKTLLELYDNPATRHLIGTSDLIDINTSLQESSKR
ncbi:MAG: hypothetical protein ACYCZQ_03205 [Burkholderiales bacterium]